MRCVLCGQWLIAFRSGLSTLLTYHRWYYVVVKVAIVVATAALYVGAMFALVNRAEIAAALALDIFDPHWCAPKVV